MKCFLFACTVFALLMCASTSVELNHSDSISLGIVDDNGDVIVTMADLLYYRATPTGEVIPEYSDAVNDKLPSSFFKREVYHPPIRTLSCGNT